MVEVTRLRGFGSQGANAEAGLADVFISYKSEDHGRIAPLARALEARGYTVWWDLELIAGQKWARKIKAELDAAKCVIVAWTCACVAKDRTYVSEWVENEADEALRRGVLVPVLMDEGRIAWTHQKVQYATLIGWNGESNHPGLAALLDGVVQHAGLRAKPEEVELAAWGQADTEVAEVFHTLAARLERRFAEIELKEAAARATRELGGAAPVAPQRQTPPPPPKNVPLLMPEMVRIPPGRFLMGSATTEERWKHYDGREEPEHDVRIDYAFDLGRYEVTVDELAAFVTDAKHDTGDSAYLWDGKEFKDAPGKGWRDPGFTQTGQHPVCCVNWNDAKAYIAWLNAKLGLDRRSDAYRLPSEAEWEYACRAGTTTPFSFGATISTAQANHDGNYTYGAQTMPVGSFPANAFGLHDMHGNVAEWCEDAWNANYKGAPADGSAWLTGETSQRVLRGGSWIDDPPHLRSTVRNRNIPTIRNDWFGFRLARTVSTPNR